MNDPKANKVGKFAISARRESREARELLQQQEEVKEEVEDPPNNPEVVLSPASLSLSAVAESGEKSRRFSKLPPVSQDSPNAVKLGSKFTMIPHQDANSAPQ